MPLSVFRLELFFLNFPPGRHGCAMIYLGWIPVFMTNTADFTREVMGLPGAENPAIVKAAADRQHPTILELAPSVSNMVSWSYHSEKWRHQR